MRFVLAAFLLALLPLSADAAREPAPDYVVLTHTKAVVEQQVPQSCAYDGDLRDCVTNTGPCLFDADDSLWVSAPDGTYTGCQFTDWAGHAYRVRLSGHKRLDLAFDITLSPALNLTGDGTSEHVSSFHFDQQVPLIGPYDAVYGCVDVQVDHEDSDLGPVPSQGGGGEAYGLAIPTTITISGNGSLFITVGPYEPCPNTP